MTLTSLSSLSHIPAYTELLSAVRHAEHERGPLEVAHLREVIVTAKERARHFTAYLRASASLCLFSALDSHILSSDDAHLAVTAVRCATFLLYVDGAVLY